MTTITCQWTGISFEAKSSRAKNHPQVAELLTRANKLNQYAAATSALAEGRAIGLTTIEEFIALAESAMKADRAAYAAQVAEMKAERERRWREAAEYRARRGWLDTPDNQGELGTEADRREVDAKLAAVRTSEE